MKWGREEGSGIRGRTWENIITSSITIKCTWFSILHLVTYGGSLLSEGRYLLWVAAIYGILRRYSNVINTETFRGIFLYKRHFRT